MLERITGNELRCLSKETYDKLKNNDIKIRKYIEKLNSVIDNNNK